MDSFPDGYWEFDQDMRMVEIARIKDELQAHLRDGAMFMLPSSVRFVPFNSNLVPNAFCRYCASPNLDSSFWCARCGAQMLDGDSRG